MLVISVTTIDKRKGCWGILSLTSARRYMFLPAFICLFVCLSVCFSVCNITQKVMDQF